MVIIFFHICPLVATLLLPVSINLTTLCISYKWIHTGFVLFWLVYFTWHNVLRVHPCCNMCQNVFAYWGQILLHCMYTPCFVYSSVSEHLNCFCLWLLCIMVLWTWVYKYLFKTFLLILLGIDLEIELLDHEVILLNFLRNSHTIFHRACTISHFH